MTGPDWFGAIEAAEALRDRHRDAAGFLLELGIRWPRDPGYARDAQAYAWLSLADQLESDQLWREYREAHA